MVLQRNNDEKSSVCCGCQWWIQGRGTEGPPPPPSLFLDQTEARKAEKNLFGDRAPPYLKVWIRHRLLSCV